jgi:hypothetical protein
MGVLDYIPFTLMESTSWIIVITLDVAAANPGQQLWSSGFRQEGSAF